MNTVERHLAGKVAPTDLISKKKIPGVLVNLKPIERKAIALQKTRRIEKTRAKKDSFQASVARMKASSNKPMSINGQKVKIGKWNPKKIKFNIKGANKGSFSKTVQTSKKLLKKKK